MLNCQFARTIQIRINLFNVLCKTHYDDYNCGLTCKYSSSNYIVKHSKKITVVSDGEIIVVNGETVLHVADFANILYGAARNTIWEHVRYQHCRKIVAAKSAEVSRY